MAERGEFELPVRTEQSDDGIRLSFAKSNRERDA